MKPVKRPSPCTLFWSSSTCTRYMYILSLLQNLFIFLKLFTLGTMHVNLPVDAIIKI